MKNIFENGKQIYGLVRRLSKRYAEFILFRKLDSNTEYTNIIL